MKIAVIGSGISGLSISRLLSSNNEVVIFEKNNSHGGIAKTRTVNEISYHITGGHCFNSIHQDVNDFVFTLMPQHHWHKVERNAVIKFKNLEINYPIEFSIKQIAEYDTELAINMVRDFLNTNDDNNYLNLEDWFRKKFGNTLAEEYFLPYNSKIWNKEPSSMDPAWVKDKLPIPNKLDFFNSLLGQGKDKMPHSNFYYPNSNNQNTFINMLANGLNIIYNFKVESLFRDIEKQKWVINKEFDFDLVINTSPLNELPKLLDGCPTEILEAANSLEYNRVTTMLWESKPTNRTWTYIPDPNILFHRYIHIGNFFIPNKNYTITEAVGELKYEQMLQSGEKDDFLIKPLDYHVSDHAYVVFNQNYLKNKNIIFDYLHNNKLYTLGRFGEWEYYNMDICIKKAIDLNNKLKNILHE